MLAINKRSTVWWLENSEYSQDGVGLRIPWFAADIAGALVTGIVAGVINSQVGDGCCCCTDEYGATVVAGAILASTGAIFRVGRVLHRIFSV